MDVFLVYMYFYCLFVKDNLTRHHFKSVCQIKSWVRQIDKYFIAVKELTVNAIQGVPQISPLYRNQLLVVKACVVIPFNWIVHERQKYLILFITIPFTKTIWRDNGSKQNDLNWLHKYKLFRQIIICCPLDSW
jgi:hypothetical protein